MRLEHICSNRRSLSRTERHSRTCVCKGSEVEIKNCRVESERIDSEHTLSFLCHSVIIHFIHPLSLSNNLQQYTSLSSCLLCVYDRPSVCGGGGGGGGVQGSFTVPLQKMTIS